MHKSTFYCVSRVGKSQNINNKKKAYGRSLLHKFFMKKKLAPDAEIGPKELQTSGNTV